MIEINKDFILKSEQEKVVKLMFSILEFNQDTEQEVKKCIDILGIKEFLTNIYSLNFTDEVKEKVNALKEIIDNIDGITQPADFCKGGLIDDE